MNTILLLGLVLGTTPTPPLVAEPAAVDRGEVRTGPPIVQSFTLTNQSEAWIAFDPPTASCGCLRPTLSHRELKPGESATVSLTVNTLTQPAGPNTWRVSVPYRRLGTATSDSIELRVAAKLVSEITVTPPIVAISSSHAVDSTIEISDRRAKPFTILSATPSHDGLRTHIGPAETRSGVRITRVRVEVPESFPVGLFDATLTLLTDDPTCRELRIPIQITKRPAQTLLLTPNEWNVTLDSSSAEPSRLIQVRRADAGILQIQEVVSNNPAIEARWSASAGPVATVRVRLKSHPQREAVGEATAIIKLSNPLGQELSLPIRWKTR